MFIPPACFVLCAIFYQAVCFRIYGVAKVRRANYFVMDHQHLAYLNGLEKAQCGGSQ